MPPEKTRHLGVFAAFLAVSGMLFQLASLRPAQEFLTFRHLAWAPSPNCTSELIELPPFSKMSAATAQGNASCVSEPIPVYGNRVEIEYSAVSGKRSAKKMKIALERPSGETIEEFSPSNYDGDLHLHSVNFSEDISAVRLRLSADVDADEYVRIRNRLNFYQRSRLQGVSGMLSEGLPSIVVTAAFALALLFVFRITSNGALPIRFVVLLAAAALLHYRPYLTFSFDEWYLLDRIVDYGFGAAAISHNEHFIPLAITLYTLEHSLFGGTYWAYIAVSLFIHTATAIALSGLFQRLLPDFAEKSSAAHLLGCLFLINGLHAEALQWCMCQGTLLATLASVLALNAAFDYCVLQKISALLRLCAWCIAAIFSFAGAFVLPFQIAAIALRTRMTKRTWAIIALAISVTFSASFFAYTHAKDAGGLKILEPELASAPDLFRYVAGGTQFGTVFRGLGFYPRVEHRPLAKFLPSTIVEEYGEELPLAALGTVVSLAILAYYFFYSSGEAMRRRIWFWVTGELFLTLPFLITSVARARFGTDYAIRSLRYQTPATLGLMILIAPLVCDLLSRMTFASSSGRRLAAGAALFAYCFGQLWFVMHFNTFRDIDFSGRRYEQQLLQWRSLSGGKFEPSFEEIAASPGNYPVLYSGVREKAEAVLTPIHPEKILRIIGASEMDS